MDPEALAVLEKVLSESAGLGLMHEALCGRGDFCSMYPALIIEAEMRSQPPEIAAKIATISSIKRDTLLEIVERLLAERAADPSAMLDPDCRQPVAQKSHTAVPTESPHSNKSRENPEPESK